MMIKKLLLALALVIPSFCSAQTQSGRVQLAQNAAMEQQYASGTAISTGQLVTLSGTTQTIGGIVYGTVIPTTTGTTTGILGVADGTVGAPGLLLNIRIAGQGPILVDGVCAIGNYLSNSITIAGDATCSGSIGTSPVGFSLTALASAGTITGIVSPGTGGSSGGGSPGAPPGCLQANVSGAFGCVVNSNYNSISQVLTLPINGNAFIKGPLSEGRCYASKNGNDANDGQSFGSPKQYVDSCIMALPNGATSPPTAGNGTVYTVDGTQISPTAGCGIFFMGPADPNYSSPPTCWMRVPNGSVSITVEGVPYGNYGPGHKGKAQLLNGGGTYDRNHPGFWSSNTSSAIALQNIQLIGSGREIVIGECSNNDRTGLCNSSDIDFNNVNGSLNVIASNGPCIDITGASFWVWFKDWSCSGTDNVNTPTSDIAAAALIDGHGNPGMGLIHFRDGVTADGGIKMYAGVNILNNMYIENFTTEGTKGEPSVWAAASGQAGDANINVYVNNIEVADATTTSAGLEVDVPGAGVSAFNIFGQGVNVVGPAVILSQYPSNLLNTTTSPLSQGQQGFANGRAIGQNSDVDHLFVPETVGLPNIASTSSAGWTPTYGAAVCTLTGGQLAPDRSNTATLITYTSGTGNLCFTAFYILGNTPLNLGDYYTWEAWVKSGTNNGYSQNEPILFTLNGDGYGAGDQCNNNANEQSLGNNKPPFLGDGEWERIWGICKVTQNPTNGGIVLYSQVNSTHSLVVWGPTLTHIPNGTASNNEAFNFASALQSYSNTCSTGQLCLVSGPAFTGGAGSVTNPNGNFTLGEDMFAVNNTTGIAGAPGVLNCAAYTGATLDVIFNACVTAAIAAGDWMADMSAFSGAQTVAAQLNAGDVGGDPLVIKLPAVFTWTSNSGFTGGTSCLIEQYSNTYLMGQSPLLKGQFKNGSSTGALKSVYCNAGPGYYKAKDFTIYNPSVATASGVGFMISGAFDNSIWQSIDVADYQDSVAAIEVTGASCCSFKLIDMTANGNYTLAAPTLLILSNNSATVNGLEVRGGSFDHPSAGIPNIQCTDTSTVHNSHIIFSGQLYEEGPNSGTTGSINNINGCGSVTVEDNEIKAEIVNSTATAWSITNTTNTGFKLGKVTMILNFVQPATAVANSFTGETILTDPVGNLIGYNSGESYFYGISTKTAVIGTYTVSTLPTPSTLLPGSITTVTDSLAPGSCTTGGGTNPSLCYDTGTAWISISGGSVGTGTPNALTDWATANTLGSVIGNVTNQIVIAQNGAAPIFASAGVGGNFNISASTYTIQCDSATTTIDRLHNLIFTDAAGATVTVPDAGTSGCANNFAFSVGAGPGAGNITIQRASASVFMVLTGSTALANQVSFILTAGQYATISTPDNINWLVFEKTGGGGSGTPCTTTANSLQFDSSGTFGCTAPFTFASNTITGAAAAILDLSAATGTAAFKVPVAAGETATAAGVIDFDSTNKNFHGYVNGADSIFANFAAAPTNNVIPKSVIATGNTLLANSLLTDNATTATYTGTGGFAASSYTSTGTTAGFIDFPQGATSSSTAPCNTATSICEQAPTSVTSYLVTKPGVAANGIETNNVASAVDTQGFSGDTNHSATVTIGSGTSIGSTSLCSSVNCPAGTYLISGYVDITTACGTSGTYLVDLIYTDDQGAKTVPLNINGTGAVSSTGVLTTTSTSNFGQESQVIRTTGSTSINYSTTAVACGTAGPMVGKLYLSAVPVQ